MKISQREAQRLRKRVTELESERNAQHRAWSSDFPGGTAIDTITVSDTEWWIVKTARRLGHAVVVTTGDNPKLCLFGLRLPR
jgi:hypothetical protein